MTTRTAETSPLIMQESQGGAPGLLQGPLTLSLRAAALGGEAIPTMHDRALGIASSLTLLAMTDQRRLCNSPGTGRAPSDKQSSRWYTVVFIQQGDD
jgi:hypothetical protein